jgi:hypothetical protein
VRMLESPQATIVSADLRDPWLRESQAVRGPAILEDNCAQHMQGRPGKRRNAEAGIAQSLRLVRLRCHPDITSTFRCMVGSGGGPTAPKRENGANRVLLFSVTRLG